MMRPIEPTPYSKDYEITDAMFGAFRSPGGAPFFWKLFLWGTLLFSLMGVLVFPGMIGSYVDIIQSSLMVETDPGNVDLVFGSLWGFSVYFLLFMVAYVIILALLRAAFFRGYFFGETGGTIPFELGGDEIRQGLAILGFLGIYLAAVMAATVILMIPFVGIVLIAGEGSIGGMILSIILLYVGLIVIIVWVGMRFVCAGALTALRGQTHVLAARHVSKNRFWALFGSYLVAGLIGYIATYTLTTVGVLVAFSGLTAGDLLAILSGTDPDATFEALERASETTVFRLTSIIAIVLTSAGYSFYFLILSGPQAFFTRQWAEAGDAMMDDTV